MLEISQQESISEIRMHRPPVNALNMELVETLTAALQKEVKNGAKAIVISGKEGLFSAGLDVPDLMSQSRNTVTVFWDRFFKLMHTVLASPVPVIAAVTGHAPAGGAVLAIHCDYRVAAAGEFRIGLNEVQVGLVVPPPVLEVLQHIVGSRQAARLATTGAMLDPATALEIGLVDEVVAPGEVVARAKAVAADLLRLPPVAMNATRLNAKAELVGQHVSADAIRIMTDYWFSAETQATMTKLVASLGK